MQELFSHFWPTFFGTPTEDHKMLKDSHHFELQLSGVLLTFNFFIIKHLFVVFYFGQCLAVWCIQKGTCDLHLFHFGLFFAALTENSYKRDRDFIHKKKSFFLCSKSYVAVWTTWGSVGRLQDWQWVTRVLLHCLFMLYDQQVDYDSL